MDTADLGDDDASELRRLVEGARLGDKGAHPAGGHSQADRYVYEVTVVGDDGTTQAVSGDEVGLSPERLQLAQWVMSKGGSGTG